MRKSVRKTEKKCKQERAGKENNNKSIKGQQEGESVDVVVKGQCEGESDSKAMNVVGGGDDLMIKVHYLHHENNNKSIKEQQEGESEAMNVVVVVVKGQCEGESDSKAMNDVGGGDDLTRGIV